MHAYQNIYKNIGFLKSACLLFKRWLSVRYLSLAHLWQARPARLNHALRRLAPLWMIFLVLLHVYGASLIGKACAENP